jgi:hypothetical protein
MLLLLMMMMMMMMLAGRVAAAVIDTGRSECFELHATMRLRWKSQRKLIRICCLLAKARYNQEQIGHDFDLHVDIHCDIVSRVCTVRGSSKLN